METKIKENIIYEGKVVKLKKDLVKCSNGNESYREVISHNGGAGILAINENNEILLVKQYRYALNRYMLEIPAGKLEKNEDPFLAAKRELEEETGFKTDDIISLGSFIPTCGYSNEVIYLYLAKNLKVGEINFDEDEDIESKFYPLDDVLKMIDEGKILDGKTILAILKYLRLK